MSGAEVDHEVHTDRLLLRRWRDADREPFAELNADPEVMAGYPRTLTRAESDARAARSDGYFDERGFGLWAVEVPGVAPFIGFAGLSIPQLDAHFTPTVEIAWRFARPYWGKGYATEACRAVLAHAFDVLELPEVVTWTTAANVAGRAGIERLGMRTDPADDFGDPPQLLYRITAADHARRRA